MTPRLPRKAEAVIVGGGVQGLCVAFYLTTFGVRNLVVLDAGYWQGGASGRNGTMIRPGFASVEWTRLFQLSCEQWSTMSRRLGANVMFSRRGYSLVAERPQTIEVLERSAATHRLCGVASQMLTGAERASVLPAAEPNAVAGVLQLPDGGVAPHHAMMHALLAACRRAGADVRYRRPVTGFERRGCKIAGVVAGAETIEADAVVIAAGAHSPEMARLAGVSLEGRSTRLEAMALEPMRPLIRPGIALIDSLCYLHQTARGEIVGGAEAPERPRMTLKSDLPTMAATAEAYARVFPRLADLRILRHWAGMIHVAPDLGPLLGRHPDADNLWITAGWCYGYAGAPGAGLLLARAIARGEVDDRMEPFAPDRFARGKPVREGGIVLAPEIAGPRLQELAGADAHAA